MSKINSLDELENGDVVFLFGSPFSSRVVKEGNPFVFNTKSNMWCFRSLVNNEATQACYDIFIGTYIYKKDEFTTEDKAELILEGYGDWLNE